MPQSNTGAFASLVGTGFGIPMVWGASSPRSDFPSSYNWISLCLYFLSLPCRRGPFHPLGADRQQSSLVRVHSAETVSLDPGVFCATPAQSPSAPCNRSLDFEAREASTPDSPYHVAAQLSQGPHVLPGLLRAPKRRRRHHFLVVSLLRTPQHQISDGMKTESPFPRRPRMGAQLSFSASPSPRRILLTIFSSLGDVC